MINNVVLVGRITRDLDVQTAASGTSYCRYSIAMNRFGSDQTDFINCVSFGKVAENMGRFLKKGALIGVEGRLQSSSYKRQDGSNATSTEVVANTVQFLEPKGSSRTSSAPAYAAPKAAPAPKVSIEEVNKGLAKFDTETVSFDPDPKPKKEESGIDYDDIPWEI